MRSIYEVREQIVMAVAAPHHVKVKEATDKSITNRKQCGTNADGASAKVAQDNRAAIPNSHEWQ